MAKVMVSIPDDLLRALDRHARERGRTRSGLLQDLAARELAAGAGERRRLIGELLADPQPQDGRATEWVREARRSR